MSQALQIAKRRRDTDSEGEVDEPILRGGKVIDLEEVLRKQ
jgi:hypothetical protein